MEFIESASAGSPGAANLFSSDAAKILLEQEFLKAGVRIRQICPNLGATQRPLGHMTLETLGFGSLIVTYRNCPNNAPLTVILSLVYRLGKKLGLAEPYVLEVYGAALLTNLSVATAMAVHTRHHLVCGRLGRCCRRICGGIGLLCCSSGRQRGVYG